jgi:hypothetical protein
MIGGGLSPVALRSRRRRARINCAQRARGEHPKRGPTAREILHALLDGAHLEGFVADGSAVLSWTVDAALLDALCAWDGGDLEDDEIDHGAPECRFFGGSP